MAEKQNPSRRASENRNAATRQAPARRANTDKQAPTRRNDVIRCENCGEDYSITYKRCPFCDERPGRSGIGGRRAVGGGYGPSVHPIQVIGLVVSLIFIIAALFIVFKYVGPLLFGSKGSAGSSSSVSTSQSGGQTGTSASSELPGVDGSSSSGDASLPDVPAVTVNSIQLSREDFTLQPNEEYQLTATVSPTGAKVVWTSSNPEVLTVDEDGIVKNINSGSSLVKTSIIATAGDKSAECTVYCRPGGAGGSSASTGSQTSGGNTGTSQGPVAANTPGTIVNAGSGLNIRSGPGSSYEKIASASNGAKITILEDAGNGWYKIDYGGGKTGYVSSNYVSVGN